MAVKILSVLFSLSKGVLLGIDRHGNPQWATDPVDCVGHIQTAPMFADMGAADHYLGSIKSRPDFPTDCELRQVPTAIGKDMASENDVMTALMPGWSGPRFVK